MGPLNIDSTIKLASGSLMPRFGLGVYRARGEECEDAVKESIKAGYRSIDSAQAYHNEDLVGQAVKDSGVPRKDLYLTTKYMPTHQVHPASEVFKHVRRSLWKIDQTGQDSNGNGKGKMSGQERSKTVSKEAYIDLILIHAPWGGEEGRKENWKALAQAQEEGWVKDIGVSNFGVPHLEALPPPLPAVNQIELHPWCQQRPIVSYCQKKGIAIEAYSPLVQANKKRFQDPVLLKICEKQNKDQAQILIRWSLQKGYICIPKSVNPGRIKSNANVFDFELDKADVEALDGLDEGSKGAVTWNPVDSP